jgi:NAD(P)-dependent dehydrogenase (short-subunit alcohol dehydrogenase family)
VAATSNDRIGGAALEAELNRHQPGTLTFIECDVRHVDQIDAMVSAAVEQYGRIDVLVNNVGYNSPGKTLDEATLEEISDLLSVNLLSCILVTRAALRHLRESAGSIVNIGSLAASLGHEHLAVYCAAKGGISSFSRAMAIDETRFGVRVNTVIPGNILTSSRERLEASMPETEARHFHDLVESWQWMGRSGLPAEVAQACLFLAGSGSSFITGSEIVVSGGADLGFGPKRWSVVDGHVTTDVGEKVLDKG